MDRIYEQTMLFDFYGELLTEHQRSIYEDAVYNDMSLGEIAEEQGISRQGVHDLIKRCDRILQDYESKLHLVERFMRAKASLREISRLAEEAHEEMLATARASNAAHALHGDVAYKRNLERAERIQALAAELIEEL